MPTLKKRSGKTTITLYAQEERQIVGSIDIYNFAETNGDEKLKVAGKELAERAAAFLKMLEPPPPVARTPKSNTKDTPLIDDEAEKPY